MNAILTYLQIYVLLFVAIIATCVVLERDPAKQTVGLSLYGLTLGILFFLFQAPDVALSQIVIGAVVLPLMVLLSIAKIKKEEEET